ncbi:hypothetical protein [Agriterribacter sp.]|uniref:hypothetical protein n=1 Tax=Agriterribacter sp. TaxID=2821509 RepID=UPI002B9AF590|nr:hypothetical protein [Agriterribacter sp.]HTN08312.1 hypothetical protein [Agriterribacter sp.]
MKLIFKALGCMLLAACSNKLNTAVVNENEPETLTAVSLFTDNHFEKGFFLKGDVSGIPSAGESLYPFGGEGQKPVWELAEWTSKYLLHQSNMVEKDGTKWYENKGKLVSFKREGKDTHIRLDVKAAAEYDHPRKNNEPWPHLLIEQEFPVKPLLKDMENLFLHFEGRLIDCVSKMPADTFDPGLHSAQFQVFIIVQNRNQQSPEYGDYLWFGVPFYDYRHKQQQVYAARDVGKGDATGKFIYSLGNADYMKGSFHDKKWIKIEKDLKPFMLKAVTIAKERGYLVGSSVEELGVTGMNIGWEVPGIFDAGFEFKGFDLIYTPVKN